MPEPEQAPLPEPEGAPLPEPERAPLPEPEQGPSGDEPITGAVVPGTDARIQRRPAGPVASRPGSAAEPSWAKVLGTTVQLWLTRRPLRQRVIGVLVAALVVFAAGGLTVALIRHAGPVRPARGGSTAAPPAAGVAALRTAAEVRQAAAAWVAVQVSHSAVVSCDPAMCAALQARGFPAGDLITLGPGTRDPLGSAVVISTAAVRSLFGDRLTTVYAPATIASFGSGSAQIDIRVYAAGGAAAYLAALRADEAARRQVGRLLAGNPRIIAAPAARQQLAAGQVDSRLLITIGTLSHQGPVRIVAFGDSGPGASAGEPLRTVEIARPPGAGSGYLTSVLGLLRAQQVPYLASSAKPVFLASGRELVQVIFDAPSPLGLLNR